MRYTIITCNVYNNRLRVVDALERNDLERCVYDLRTTPKINRVRPSFSFVPVVPFFQVLPVFFLTRITD